MNLTRSVFNKHFGFTINTLSAKRFTFWKNDRTHSVFLLNEATYFQLNPPFFFLFLSLDQHPKAHKSQPLGKG